MLKTSEEGYIGVPRTIKTTPDGTKGLQRERTGRQAHTVWRNDPRAEKELEEQELFL